MVHYLINKLKYWIKLGPHMQFVQKPSFVSEKIVDTNLHVKHYIKYPDHCLIANFYTKFFKRPETSFQNHKTRNRLLSEDAMQVENQILETQFWKDLRTYPQVHSAASVLN